MENHTGRWKDSACLKRCPVLNYPRCVLRCGGVTPHPAARYEYLGDFKNIIAQVLPTDNLI